MKCNACFIFSSFYHFISHHIFVSFYFLIFISFYFYFCIVLFFYLPYPSYPSYPFYPSYPSFPFLIQVVTRLDRFSLLLEH